jgi:hypothetical protein
MTTDRMASQWGSVDGAIDPAILPTTDLLASLVRINSVDPSLIPGAAGETEIARFVKRWLDERGIPCEIHEAAPNRPSVIARVPGKGGGRMLLRSGDDPRHGRCQLLDGCGIPRGCGDPHGCLWPTWRRRPCS